jgi:hypothetical protein
VGWLHCADEALVARARRSGVFVSGGVPCQLPSRIAAYAMEHGALDAHLTTVRSLQMAEAAPGSALSVAGHRTVSHSLR